MIFCASAAISFNASRSRPMNALNPRTRSSHLPPELLPSVPPSSGFKPSFCAARFWRPLLSVSARGTAQPLALYHRRAVLVFFCLAAYSLHETLYRFGPTCVLGGRAIPALPRRLRSLIRRALSDDCAHHPRFGGPLFGRGFDIPRLQYAESTRTPACTAFQLSWLAPARRIA